MLMRHHLFIAAIFLLAGAVVNVAVTWGLVTWTVIALNDRANSQPFALFSYKGTVAAGWPTEALGYTWTSNEFPAYSSLRPIWPGLAVNTLFYAALLWLPFAVRQWIRMWRGLCPRCGYPMGESDLCTECGKPLPGRAKATT